MSHIMNYFRNFGLKLLMPFKKTITRPQFFTLKRSFRFSLEIGGIENLKNSIAPLDI